MMKKRMKKSFCVFLSVLMLLTGVLGVAASAKNRADADVPTIWCQGQGSYLINSAGDVLFPVDTPDGFVSDAVADCMGDFADAVMLGEIEEYKVHFLQYIDTLYNRHQLDENGQNTYDCFCPKYPTTGAIHPNPTTQLECYPFYNDWRLSPYENAAKLKEYIAMVKAASGSDTVNLYGRCEGSTMVLTYLYLNMDDLSDINKVALNIAAAGGEIVATETFSGDININSNLVSDWAAGNLVFEDEDVEELFNAFMLFMQKTPGMELTASAINKIYSSTFVKILPDVLLHSFATYPGIWAMVDNDHFEQAIKFVFSGKGIVTKRDENGYAVKDAKGKYQYYEVNKELYYKGLIDYITKYHNEVQLHMDDILQEVRAKGHEVGIFTKYGYPSYPLFVHSNLIGDGGVSVKAATFGATAAGYGEVLSEEYMASVTAAGKGKYISPDKQIDCSTALFPDTTWIVKNVNHNIFPVAMDNMIVAFLNTPGCTVDTYSQYPQYTVLTANPDIEPSVPKHPELVWGSLQPLTAENNNGTEPTVTPTEEEQEDDDGIFDAIIDFFKKLVAFIRNLFNGGSLDLSGIGMNFA